jgi:hypothetical protein
MLECLPCKCKALSSNSRTAKNQPTNQIKENLRTFKIMKISILGSEHIPYEISNFYLRFETFSTFLKDCGMDQCGSHAEETEKYCFCQF